MKRNKKWILALTTVLCLSNMVACGKKEAKEETYDGTKVETIQVTSDVNDIVFKKSQTDEIKLSIDGYEGNLANLNGDVLTIELPEEKGGVHIKKKPSLVIELPDKAFASVQAKSEAGSIEVQKVDAKEMNVQSEYGDISISGVSGEVVADSDYGEIKTGASIDADVSEKADGQKEHLKGKIGTDAEGKNITLKTGAGDIEIQ